MRLLKKRDRIALLVALTSHRSYRTQESILLSQAGCHLDARASSSLSLRTCTSLTIAIRLKEVNMKISTTISQCQWMMEMMRYLQVHRWYLREALLATSFTSIKSNRDGNILRASLTRRSRCSRSAKKLISKNNPSSLPLSLRQMWNGTNR